MELSWVTFLISLACFVFGTSCSVLIALGESSLSDYCPRDMGSSNALVTVGVAAMLPSLLMMNEDADDKTNLHAFFTQFRVCALALLWLRSGGRIWVLFANLGAESFADLLKTIATSVQRPIKPKLAYALATKLLELATLAAVYKLNNAGFVACSFALRLIRWDEDDLSFSTSSRSRLALVMEFLGPVLAGLLLFEVASVETAVALLVGFEVVTALVFVESLPTMQKEPSAEGRFTLTMPSHRAAVVVGSLALLGTGYSALSPSILSAYVFWESDRALSPALGLMFASAALAEVAGPYMGDRVHRETGSLLKTGLITFWLASLFIMPTMLIYGVPGGDYRDASPPRDAYFPVAVKQALILLTCAGWRLAFSAVASVESRIVSEWSNAHNAHEEQKAMTSIGIIVVAVVNVLMASSLSEPAVVTASTIFALFCSLLGAACYTVWFARNDRGPWRLVDGEGRELLRVTG